MGVTKGNRGSTRNTRSTSGADKKNTIRGRKRTSNGGGRSLPPNKTGVQEDEKILRLKMEIKLLTMLCISVVLLIGVLGGGKGPLIFIGGFLFGLFGVLGYIFPVALFVIYTFILAHRNSKRGKLLGFVWIFMLLMSDTLIYIVSSDMERTFNAKDIYLSAIASRTGGGLIGSIPAYLLYSFFGKPASLIIIIVAILISMIVITQKSLLGGIKKGGDRIYNTTVSNFHKRRERFERIHKNEVSEKELGERISVFEIGDRFDLLKDDRTQERAADYSADINIGMRELSLNAGDGAFNEEAVAENTTNIHIQKSIFDRGYKAVPAGIKAASIADAVDNADKNESEDKYNKPDLKPAGNTEADAYIAAVESFDASDEHMANNDVAAAKYNVMRAYENNKDAACTDNAADEAYADEAAEDMTKWQDSSDATDTEETEYDEDMSAAYVTDRDSANAVSCDDMSVTKDTEEACADNSGQAVTAAEPYGGAEYRLPPLELLRKGKDLSISNDATEEIMQKLENTLRSFNIDVKMSGVSVGPTVTRYEMTPAPGVKVSRIQALSDDIKLALAATDIRIEAPIPGKSAVGVEVPNVENSMVSLRSLLQDDAFRLSKCRIPFAVGKDLSNNTIVEDIARMPHLLIAGATGSGKSVCINTLIMSILYKARPDEVKLIMIDPKVVELSIYNGIPHLLTPIVTDPRKAAGALNWAVAEMTRRYQLFANIGVRDLKGYNRWIRAAENAEGVEAHGLCVLPQIVIIVDELADLMMVSAKEAEEAICRLAQLARAAGMHLILATQRPSVNVITGLIKANMPSRIAFAVTSGVDSRTILDMNGAEKLLGKGDMLFGPQWLQKPIRLQGAFVSDEEVEAVVSFLKEQAADTDSNDDSGIDEEINRAINSKLLNETDSEGSGDELDPLFMDAAGLVINKEKASIGMLQRALKIGFNRAGRIMDQMEAEGIVGADEGTKPRSVLMDEEAFASYMAGRG